MDTIAPMLASPSTGAGNRQPVSLDELAASGKWHGDLKLDGLRAMLYVHRSGAVTMLNRSGVRVEHLFPEVVDALMAALDGLSPGGGFVLDGEIVAENGRFESVATRGKQSSAAAALRMRESLPCRYIAFDVLRMADRDLLGEPFSTRRDLLTALCGLLDLDVVVSSANLRLLWDNVTRLGLEGLIAKRIDSPYLPGKRSPAWVKFKTVRRVSCIAVGYEPGQGARAHFGKMHLAMVGPTGAVSVGKVGTGFTEAEIRDLKARLDAGQPFVVEIEALNRTSSNVLRFPVYRGIRSDLSVLDATIDQLDTLPRC